MSDLISRQAAIDICNYAADLWHGQLGEGIVIAVRKRIEQLPSSQPEIIHCAECKWLQCNMRQDGTLPKGVDEFECRHWCGYCDPVDFCSHAERRTDG